jgi:OmpA-OmpF porin, OOP family
MKVKTLLLIMIGSVTLCASSAFAEIQPGSFNVSPNIGGYFFDSDQQIKNSVTYGAGLGYDITERWGLEGTINLLNTEFKTGGVDIDGYLGRLDALYYFMPKQKFVPYLAVGVGDLSLDPSVGDSKSKFIANYGLGMKYFLTDKIALRADVRHVLTFPENNVLATIGVSFVFGGEKKAPAVKETPAPKPAPQPAPPKDSDGDGVIDDKDQCPNTPVGVKVDSVGCPLDSDKDGVADYLDQCPNTPAGVKVDSVGCPLDSDKDGVPDYLDKCPDTPAGVKVDSVGCPLDSDKDGVPDYLDKCSDTPAEVKVDSAGCPLDSDMDGVADYLDQCPDTPKGATVNKKGCWILKDLEFDTAKATIKPEYTKLLEDVVSILKENPSLKVEIQGHTDNVGTARYNEKLSMRRAEAVMDYMLKKGIARDRLSAKGYGFTRPIESNDTPQGREDNRRVELNPIK